MHSRLIASIGLVGLLFASPAWAAGDSCCADKPACCEKAAKAAHDMPCCQDHHATPKLSAEETFWGWLSARATPAPAVPVRQANTVWFKQPVRIGQNILHGQYVIEHDNDRMAQGAACTYIYSMKDQKNPVVAFHCVHLERATAKQSTVVLVPGGDGFQRMTEFQFAGETGAHGLPIVR